MRPLDGPAAAVVEHRSMRLPPVFAALAVAGLLAGCSNSPRPPGDTGVCYHVVAEKGGKLRYNTVVTGIPNMETCGARLEALREQFLRMGGSHQALTGAFQSSFLFLDRTGVSASKTMDGIRYVALVRTGDGRLAVPGAMPDGAQPGR